MNIVMKSCIIIVIDGIFFMACYFIFWVLSASYLEGLYDKSLSFLIRIKKEDKNQIFNNITQFIVKKSLLKQHMELNDIYFN